MMEVNAFWFGFLIGVIALIALLGVVGMFHKPNEEEIIELTKEELMELLEGKDEEKEAEHK